MLCLFVGFWLVCRFVCFKYVWFVGCVLLFLIKILLIKIIVCFILVLYVNGVYLL